MTSHELTDWVKSTALSHGFSRVGVTSAMALPAAIAERFDSFLAEGLHAEMTYLANHVELRKNPSKLVPGARSVICLAVAYATAVLRGTHGQDARATGVVARYARGRDYHTVLKRRAIVLMDAIRERAPEFQGRAFVDLAPVAERSLAVLAGLGMIGRNGCLIVPGLGSYVLLAEIVCNLELSPDSPLPGAGETPTSHGCGDCGRCVAACPTGALRADGLLDARRCVSYHTIENRGDLPSDVETAIGNRVFGCDICQEVCPHNQGLLSGDAEFAGPASIDLHDVLAWDELQWDAATRGRAIRRATWQMWQRNALAAMANHETGRLAGEDKRTTT